MGTLTDEMARLSGEIVRIRRARGTMLKDLEQSTRARREAVAELQTDLARDHREMARAARAARAAFISDLSRTVSGLRRALRDDLRGARLAWAPEEQRQSSDLKEPARAAGAKR